MKITRTSPITGATHVREINVTQEQINKWQDGELIQNAMPHLSAGDREWILSGITDAEWEDMFGESDS
jgi:hypothetical protein